VSVSSSHESMRVVENGCEKLYLVPVPRFPRAYFSAATAPSPDGYPDERREIEDIP